VTLLYRRGPRYRLGYVIDVLQYIVQKQRRNYWRPVHIANSIATRDLRMSKSTWLRMVRIGEALGVLERQVIRGYGSKGSLYRVLQPPEKGRLPSPNGHASDTRMSTANGTDTAPLSASELNDLITGVSGSNTGVRYPSPRVEVPETDKIEFLEVLQIPQTGPIPEITSSTLEVPNRPKGREDGDSRSRGAGLLAGGPQTPAPEGGRSPNLSPTPSLRQKRAAGAGVPVKVYDGTSFEIPRSGPPPEISAAVRELLRKRHDKEG
jgi:hypothetical protein